MQKRALILVLLISFALLSSTFLVSAFSFSDFWGKITGNTISQSDVLSDLNPKSSPFTLVAFVNTTNSTFIQSIYSRWYYAGQGANNPTGFEIALNWPDPQMISIWDTNSVGLAARGVGNWQQVPSGIEAGKVYQIAITRDGTTMNIYINGIKKGTLTVTSNIPDVSSVTPSIGRSNYMGTDPIATRPFKGTIKNAQGETGKVNVYNRVLTETEIISLLPVCIENWACSSWTTCSNSQQSRTCTDTNNCGSIISKPALTQSCTTQQGTAQICVDGDGLSITTKRYVNVSICQTYNGNIVSCNTSVSFDTDYCASTQSVREYFCQNNASNSTIVNCPLDLICSDGACAPNTLITPTCTDSDGGYNIYVRGSSIDATGANRTDFCGSNVLLEYYCDITNTTQGNTTVCPNGCYDGACVSSTPTTPEAPTTPTVPTTPTCTPKIECKINPAVCPATGKQTNTCTDVNNCGISTIAPQEITCTPGACSGCKLNENCISFGTRQDVSGTTSYCNAEGKFNSQKANSEACSLDYECKTNLCSEGRCTDIETIKAEVSGLKLILIKLICKITHPLSYDSCVAENTA